MSTEKRIAMVFIGLLLVVSLSGSNVLVTADRTALTADYVTTTLESEDAYAEVTAELRESIQSELDTVTASSGDAVPPELTASDIDTDRIVENALPESYVKAQVDGVIEELYAFLHGDTDRLNLTVDLVAVKANLSAEFSTEAIDFDAADVADITASQSDGTDSDINGSTVEQLLESESNYEQTRTEFRESQREGADLDIVNRELSNELEESTRTAMSDTDQEITDAAVDLQLVTVDALTTDLTYDEYTQQVDQIEQDIDARARELVRNQFDETLPDSLSLIEEMGTDERTQLDRASGPVGLAGVLSWVVPLFCLLLIGLGYAVTRSPWSVGRMTGASALIAGAIGIISVILVRTPLTSALREATSGDGSDQFAGVAIALVEGVLSTLQNQSLLLVVAGITLLALVYADRWGHLDGLRRQLGFGPAPKHTAGTGRDQPSGQPVEQPESQPGQAPPEDQSTPGATDDQTDPERDEP